MGVLADLAEAFRYPVPGRLEELIARRERLEGVCRESFDRFVEEVGALPLSGWEELHTRTLDLSPLFAPYVGHAAWGEDYRRGAFMSGLNRRYAGTGIETDGELPDHLVPVLRYLDTASDPFPDLMDVVGPALLRMRRDLEEAEPANPYLHLLDTATTAVAATAAPTGG